MSGFFSPDQALITQGNALRLCWPSLGLNAHGPRPPVPGGTGVPTPISPESQPLTPLLLRPGSLPLTLCTGQGVRWAHRLRARAVRTGVVGLQVTHATLPSERRPAHRDSLTQEDGWSGQCSVPELEYRTSSLTNTEMARRMKERNRFRWI